MPNEAENIVPYLEDGVIHLSFTNADGDEVYHVAMPIENAAMLCDTIREAIASSLDDDEYRAEEPRILN